MEQREFDGIWIPKRIYLSTEVCWTAKIIFMEIHSFTASGKPCFISNSRLAEFMGISETQVSKHISKLIKIGWLEQTSFDGRKRYLRSTMQVEFKADLNQSSRQTLTQVQGSPELEFNHTNTVTKPVTKPVNNLHSGAMQLFCEFYQSKTGTSYLVAGGKDGTAMKQLLGKIKKKVEEAGNEPTDGQVLYGLQLMLESITDSWLLANLSIAIVNSKFNEIFNQAKNGGAKKQTGKGSVSGALSLFETGGLERPE